MSAAPDADPPPTPPPGPSSAEQELQEPSAADLAFKPLRRKRFHLLKYFTWASAAIIATVTLVAGFIGAYLVHNVYIQIEKQEADSIAEDIALQLQPIGLDAKVWPQHPQGPAIQRLLKDKLHNFDIAEFTVYDRTGSELLNLSPEGTTLEHRPLWPAGFQDALQGAVRGRWESPYWGPLVLVGDSRTGWLETYVPLRDGARVVAVARVQRNLQRVVEQDQAMLWQLVLLSGVSALLIFAGLYAVVRRANDVLLRQQLEIGRINRQLAATNARLLELDSRKDEFLAICSHDIRSPLNGILAGGQVLLRERKGPLNEIQRDILQTNQRAIQGILNLTNSLLDLARIEAGQEELHREAFRLDALIAETVAAHAGQAEACGIQIDHDCRCGGVTLHTDRIKVLRVLNNLVSNAVKHSGGQPVCIHSSQDTAPDGTRSVRIVVEDRGPGIRPEDLEKIFDRYNALARKKRTREEGTGLGLSITKALVGLLGGTLHVESTVGQGTRFTLTLPITSA